MLSSSGSASAVPSPRRTVRRGIAFFEMITTLLRTLHLERYALGNAQDDRRPPVIAGRRLADDFPDRRLVVVLDAAAERVDRAVSRSRSTTKSSRRPSMMPRRPASPSNFTPSGVTPEASIGRPSSARAIPADRVVVLEREPERIHHVVTRGTHRVAAVLLDALAHRARLLALHDRRQVGHVRRRRRRRVVEEVLEQPLAAHDRRRPVRERRDQQDAPVARAGRRGDPRR